MMRVCRSFSIEQPVAALFVALAFVGTALEAQNPNFQGAVPSGYIEQKARTGINRGRSGSISGLDVIDLALGAGTSQSGTPTYEHNPGSFALGSPNAQDLIDVEVERLLEDEVVQGVNRIFNPRWDHTIAELAERPQWKVSLGAEATDMDCDVEIYSKYKAEKSKNICLAYIYLYYITICIDADLVEYSIPTLKINTSEQLFHSRYIEDVAVQQAVTRVETQLQNALASGRISSEVRGLFTGGSALQQALGSTPTVPTNTTANTVALQTTTYGNVPLWARAPSGTKGYARMIYERETRRRLRRGGAPHRTPRRPRTYATDIDGFGRVTFLSRAVGNAAHKAAPGKCVTNNVATGKTGSWANLANISSNVRGSDSGLRPQDIACIPNVGPIDAPTSNTFPERSDNFLQSLFRGMKIWADRYSVPNQRQSIIFDYDLFHIIYNEDLEPTEHVGLMNYKYLETQFCDPPPPPEDDDSGGGGTSTGGGGYSGGGGGFGGGGASGGWGGGSGGGIPGGSGGGNNSGGNNNGGGGNGTSEEETNPKEQYCLISDLTKSSFSSEYSEANDRMSYPVRTGSSYDYNANEASVEIYTRFKGCWGFPGYASVFMFLRPEHADSDRPDGPYTIDLLNSATGGISGGILGGISNYGNNSNNSNGNSNSSSSSSGLPSYGVRNDAFDGVGVL